MATKHLEPPQNLDAERMVIGSILKDDQALPEVLAIFDDSMTFYADKHRKIFDAAKQLFAEMEPVDITTVSERLLRHGVLDKIGGRVYLIELIEPIISTANIATHAKVVLEKAQLRRLISIANDTIKSAYAQEQDARKIIDTTLQSVFDVTGGGPSGFKPISDWRNKYIEFFDACQTGDIAKSKVETGIPEVDREIWGFLPGELIVIGGQTGHGKTQAALQIAEHNASRGVPVAILSVEMDGRQLYERLTARLVHMAIDDLRSQDRLNADQINRVTEAAGSVAKMKLYVDSNPATTLDQLHGNMIQAVNRFGAQMLVVDYVQIVNHDSRGEGENVKVQEITGRLKRLARSLEVQVFGISQLRKVSDDQRRQGKFDAPREVDLLGSGAIKNDADDIIMVHHYEEHGEKAAQWVIRKKRQGSKGKEYIPVAWVNGRWESLERYIPDREIQNFV